MKQVRQEFCFSQKTKILIESLLHLAEDTSGEPQTIDSLAKKIGFGNTYIRRLLKPLLNDGIVMPFRGVTGGYVLNVEPKSVTLLYLLSSTGDAGVLCNCRADGSGKCAARGKEPTCSRHDFWHAMTDFLHDVFGSITLQDIIDGEVTLPPVASDATGGEKFATKSPQAEPSRPRRPQNPPTYKRRIF